MKKIPIFTICILSVASAFYTPKALAVNPEIFARAELGQSAESNQLPGLELQAQQEYEAERFASSIELLQRLVVNYTARSENRSSPDVEKFRTGLFPNRRKVKSRSRNC